MVKLLINEVEVKFETTIFPDGTSQVWKLQDNIDFDPNADEPTILWLFENEAELFQVLQLNALVQTHLGCDSCALRAPYLPYGRQDKAVDNKLSFALQIFLETMDSAGISYIETFDAHSHSSAMVTEDSIMPTVEEFHRSIVDHDVICFPDKGAATRYNHLNSLPIIYCEKQRDQLTGIITGLKVIANTDLTGKRILIVDDICDGGMTFIKVAEALAPFQPEQIDLAVSHGLFSKAKQCLYDAGITEIFTTNSLLRNPNGFKVC